MKCGLSMYSLLAPVRKGQLDLYGFLDYAARRGFDGVELLDMFWTDEAAEVAGAKRRCEALGLELPVYSISTNFLQPDESEREAELASLKHGVDLATQLGAPLLRVFSGDLLPGYTFEQGFSRVVDSLATGAEYAAGRQITLVLENHGKVAGRSEQVRAIIEAVDSAALRCNLDTGNFLLVGENPVEASAALADFVALVHLKDLDLASREQTDHVHAGLDGQRYTGVIVGEGLVDFSAIVEILVQQGYGGWLSLEYEGGADAMGVAVPRSLAAMRTLLQRAHGPASE
ncbi:MAG: sugar phosphate isomerase/epimerase [Anaerolineaceae bacterium]|nr:sugar phosphate isomerase/epimerase [Anaerolineaceae bacterium]